MNQHQHSPLSQTLIEQARQTNLAEYLLSKGEPLKQEGKSYRHKLHSSLIITDNKYSWNSKGEQGKTIDFLINQYGYDFKTAVNELTGFVKETLPIGEKKKNESNTLFGIQFANNQKRALAYLCKVRKIDYKLVSELIKHKLLFQEEVTNNAVFPMYDEKGCIIGAELQGTLSDVRFKGIKENSAYGYGFTVPMNKNNVKYALFFESAVDLLSFTEIEQHRNKPLTGCLLISMAGLKENIVIHTLKRLPDSIQCVLCIDNDIAGQTFAKRLKTQIRGIIEHLPDKQYKDWNEQLQNTKEN